MTYTSSGAISGTPTALGTFNVVVSATDSFALIGTGSFTWTVVAPPVVTAVAQTDEVGTAATYTASVTGTGTMTWSATGLPPGITINSTTGLMSGTPTTVNTTGSSVTVTATDAQGGSSSAVFNWVIVSAVQITTPAAQSNNAGTAITALQVVATGGQTPYTWSASGLPAGLSIASTGKITGTPTVASAGAHSVTVTVTDSLGGTATTATFSWTINYTAPTITTPANQVSDAGTAITAVQVSMSGGITPYSWSASGLPAGLSISSSGLISGTPTTAGIGQHSVTVTVTDGGGTQATTATFIWTVVAAPTIATPTNTLGSAKGVNLTGATAVNPLVSGGEGPYTWSATGLPAGLSISSTTGAITGTPTTATTYSTTLKVTDANGASDTQVISWVIVTTSATVMNIQSPLVDQFSIKGTAVTTLTPSFTGGPSSARRPGRRRAACPPGCRSTRAPVPSPARRARAIHLHSDTQGGQRQRE